MEWTQQQRDALDAARRWIDAPPGSVDQVFRLFGYAGTGKSTIAHELNDHVGGRALACAYTGKAASVMARKGLPGATTVHRLIYDPVGSDGKKRLEELKAELKLLLQVREPSRGLTMRIASVERAIREAEASSREMKFLLKDQSAVSEAPLVILDEASMVDERMGTDLLSFGTRVLVLGDPAQLPPVKGSGYFTSQEPDQLLTEIHRQAADNPILMLATWAREGRNIPLGDWGRARVVTSINARQALAADQILCGTNAKRRAINARHRQLEGHADHGPMPRAGEKLVCLKNNHERGLLNGTQWVAEDDAVWEEGSPDVFLNIRPLEGGAPMGYAAEASIFLDEDQKPQWGDSDWFTYGSAMTVHKAQGSQWDNLILFDDWTHAASRRQWLYTGLTRAAEDLTVVVG